jgi:glycosyltransferase involved in cell wall biosynthesis
MSVPFFSIILPTYNRASFLSQSIGSVIKQDYQDWELIVIDDGSTDHTKQVVNSFKDQRIKYFYQENSERSAARNNGINQAQGAWLCFLDSDDEYLKQHLKIIHKEIESNETPKMLVTGNLIRENGMQHKHSMLDCKKNILEEIASKFILMNSVCVHRDILEENRFDAKFRIWEDTHLWLRIAAQYPVYQIEQFTVIQHVHNDGTVVQGMKKIQINEVNQYVSAILDLKINHASRFEGKLPSVFFDQYIDSKYRMYLYQARQNQQFRVASELWIKAWRHRPSFYLFTEYPKIALNYLNIGLHAR